MKCQKCNSKLPKNAKYCLECGEAINRNIKQERSVKSKSKGILIITLITVLIVCLGLTYLAIGHKFTCNNCKGYGSLTCNYCEGNGSYVVSEICWKCKGKGEYICDATYRVFGWTKKCEKGYRSVGDLYFECEKCNGTGKLECSVCDGYGKNEVRKPCKKCNETGNRKCYECSGKGKLRLIDKLN